MKTIICLLSITGFSVCSAEEVRGVPRIIDGDSINIDGVEIRLHGIDAPEGKQACRVKMLDWPCGRAAAKALIQIVGDESVRCAWTERDKYGRALATCYRHGQDVGELLVRHGMALAYRKYTEQYVMAEDEARKHGLGIWASNFVPPWEWRRGERLAGNELPGIDCPVKGNVNRKGNRIYHVGCELLIKPRLAIDTNLGRRVSIDSYRGEQSFELRSPVSAQVSHR